MSEKKKLELQSVQPVVGGISEDGDPVNDDVWTYRGYRMACQQNGWPSLSFDQWDQIGRPVAWQVYEFDKYCNKCRVQGWIPFSFDEWLQLGCPREPTFKELED